MIGPTDVIKAATNLQSHQTSNVANVSQRAALAAVSRRPRRRGPRCARPSTAGGRTMHRLLDGIDGVTCLEPEGAFYAFPSFEGVLGRELGGGRAVATTARAGRP